MNIFDKTIIDFVSQHFDRSPSLYQSIFFIAEGDNLLKGGVFVIVIWFLWFRPSGPLPETRVPILVTLLSVFFVMIFTLGLAKLVPFRIRPFVHHDIGSSPSNFYLANMSSFPSDHAALFIALATGFFFYSRKIGLLAILYSLVVILFPRIYLGYHYPSDLLAGALMGASITIVFNRSTAIKEIVRKKLLPMEQNYPQYFYTLFFIVTYEIADLFAGSRNLVGFLYGLIIKK
jgi:undecaprenyl-diphosphatase